MSSDLTPAVFGLAGTFVGGVTALTGSALIERGKFTRERDAMRVDEQRRFRVEALEHVSAAVQQSCIDGFTIASMRRDGDAVSDEQIAEANRSYAEIHTWSARLHDERLRVVCTDAINACVKLSDKTTNAETFAELANEALEAVNVARSHVGHALRALYD